MEQLFGAIPSILNRLGPMEEIAKAMVFAAWPRCVGDLLHERTVPVQLVENRLVIAVSDVNWQRHLEELSPQMLVRINGLVGQGTVQFVEFRIDESAFDAVRETSNEFDSDSKTVLDVAKPLKNAANAISDEGLRNQFLGAAADYLAKQNRNRDRTHGLKSQI